MENDKINSRQMILILIIFRITMSISYMPSINFPPHNQDTWIIVLLSFFYVIPLKAPLLFLANKFKDKDIIEYLEIILGKFLGKFVGILYFLYFFFYTIIVIVIQVQLAGVNILSNTVTWLILLVLLTISIYIALKGIVSIFWTSELITTTSLIILSSLIVLGLNEIDISLLYPVLKSSEPIDINKGAFMSSLVFVDNLVLAMSIPYFKDKKSINKVFLKSVIYSIVFIVIIIVVTQTTLGIEQSRHSNYPFLLYTRLIGYNDIFERIDSIFVITWISIYVGKIATYLLLTSISLKKVFNIKKKSIPVIILALFMGIIANYIANDKLLVIDYDITNIILYISAVFTIVIPSLVCIIYFFRRKSIKDKLKNNQSNAK